MKEKILNLITIINLIIVLTAANIIFVGYNIVIALGNRLEEQNNSTNVANVQFDAYFKTEEGNVHYKQANISDAENYLYININVLDKGSLNDAKIKINDSNFKIKDQNISNTYIKNVNKETNEIELNSIIYNNSVELEIPIEFNKKDSINSEYFSKDSNISIEGTYSNDQSEEKVERTIITKLEWTDNADITLSENIEKYIDLQENGILIQQEIISKVENGMLPREKEELTINVPKIGDNLPKDIKVLFNGNKLEGDNVNYNKETEILKINMPVLVNENGEIEWNSNQNTYKVIYMYDKEENIDTINLKTSISTKLFTKENIEKEDIQDIKLELKGNVASVKKDMTKEIYKGYFYANSENETIYRESNVIEISNADLISGIKANTTNSYFIGENESTYDANNITLYKEIIINREKLIDIFGEQGYINIKDVNGNIVQTINSQTTTDDNGNINIKYEQPLENITIETSKPIKEGEFEIYNIKSIKGVTNYNREQLKTFTKFNTNEIVETNLGVDEISSETNLLDTKTEAKLEMSKTNLSTLQDNTNIQFLIVLKSNTEEYDLYKNPEININVPKEIDINLKTMSQLNAQDELKIEYAGIKTLENGDKTIKIRLKGEQTNFVNSVNEGIQIAFMADLNMDKNTPSQQSKITMTYTNENRANETFSAEEDVTLNSKYGILVNNEFTGFNANNDVLEGMDSELLSGNLDINAEEKNATETINIINNYEEEVSNVSLLVKVPAIEEEEINNELLKSTFEMNILNSVNLNGKEGKVYYSEDPNADINSDTWKENYDEVANVKTMKIELASLAQGEKAQIDYQIKIPANLQYNEETYIKNTINYLHVEENNSIVSAIKLMTAKQEIVEDNKDEQEEEGKVEQDEDIAVEVIAKTAEKYLQDGDTVKEGQGITYELKVTNNREEQLNNIQIEAINTNAIYYDSYSEEEEINGEMMEIFKYNEREDQISKIMTIDTLNPGETKTVKYQISVKEVEEENQKVTGQIKIKSDELQEKEFTSIENNIESAKLKLKMTNAQSEDILIGAGGGKIPFYLEVLNISGSKLNDIIVEVPVCDELRFIDETYLEESDKYEFVSYENKILKLKIPTIEVDEKIDINFQLVAEKLDMSITEVIATQYSKAIVAGEEFYSNEYEKTILQTQTTIVAEQTANLDVDTVYDNDNIIYTITVRNEGSIAKDVMIDDNIQIGLKINEAYLLRNGEKEPIDVYSMGILKNITLNPGEEVQLVIDTTVQTSLITKDINTIENFASISYSGQTIKTNTIVYNIVRPVDPEDPDYTNKSLQISGEAWKDENENGAKDSSEPRLSDMTVMLLDESTGEIAKDTSGEELTTKTNSKGVYKFKKLNPGKYIVLFQYDTNKYTVTEYKKDGINELSNSDIISKKVNINNTEMTVGATETLEITNHSIVNVDAGFIEGQIFDLKLDKYITNVTVQNNAGAVTKAFNRQNLAKIEIDKKQLASSTVIVTYLIEVTNEGEVAGYANEIVDYIPNDLEFSQSLNNGWSVTSDGNISTKMLENKIINPGETKTIPLTLTKKMTEYNTGNVINIAEISKSSNDYGLSDMDSSPANNKDGEDDLSKAELLISIRTGTTILYISLIITTIAIVGVGVYFINKKVLGKG